MPLQATGPQAPQGKVQFSQERDQPARGVRRQPRPRARRSRPRATVDPAKGDRPEGGDLPDQLRDVPQLRRQGRRPDPRQVRPEPDGTSPRRTSTRPWSPARSRCRSSTTRRSTPQDKRDIIAYLKTTEQAADPGRALSLGTIGPVSEGLVAWVVGLAAADRLRGLARGEGHRERHQVTTRSRTDDRSTGHEWHTPAPRRHRPESSAATRRRAPGAVREPRPAGRTSTAWRTSTRRPPSAPSARSRPCSGSRRLGTVLASSSPTSR